MLQTEEEMAVKLHSPIIYVLHKDGEQWATSTFTFDGTVDIKRVKREILRQFKKAGEVVHPAYIDAAIQASLKAAARTVEQQPLADISLAEEVHANETAD